HDVFEPHFEWHTREDLPDAGMRKGYEGAARLRDEWVETFDEFHIDLDELIEAGDHVFAVTRACGCLRGSGYQLDLREALHAVLDDRTRDRQSVDLIGLARL